MQWEQMNVTKKVISSPNSQPVSVKEYGMARIPVPRAPLIKCIRVALLLQANGENGMRCDCSQCVYVLPT